MNLDKLRKRLKRQKLEGLLVTRPENMRYLSGYSGEGMLLITRQHALLATDFRYWDQAERQAPDFEVLRLKPRKFPAYLRSILDVADKPKRVGFESTFVTVAQHQSMLDVKSVKWIAVEDMVESLRMIKTPDELALIQRAAGISDAALEYIRSKLAPGMTEQQVAWELEAYMRTHGADDIAFKVIVAAGSGGAEAHHEPGQRPIQAGEPIIMDLGARVEGYCSDITRTFCLGQPDDQFKTIYDLVLCAQESALAGIHAGLSSRAADALARDVIKQAGHGKQFGHSLGHSVGLAIHESPPASRKSKMRLPAGATLTVEPGVYIPGWGGVRIEDLVVIGKNSVELISHADKNPII